MRKKGDKKPLSPTKVGKILAFSKIGLTGQKISERMLTDFGVNVTQQTVSNICKRDREPGGVLRSKNPGSGRPRKTSERTDHVIKRLALATRKQSFMELTNSVEESTGIRLSPNTIRSRLSENGIGSYQCARKPLLSKANRKKRRDWAKKYSEKDLEFWKNVIWSDESRFCLVSDKPQRCLRMPHERLNKDCIQTTVKFGGGGVMVWGCFSYNGVGELFWAKESINTDYYLKIMRSALIPSIKKLHPDGQYIYQQDNAPCHVSHKAKNWFQNRTENRKKAPIPIMDDWPPQSPDMNPIEHIWDYIGRKIQKETFSNQEALFTRIKQIWDNLDEEYVHHLVLGMPDRVQELRSKRGGATRY